MQTVMAKTARPHFFKWLANPDAVGTVLDREFDNDNGRLTGEALDWHECRHWPSLATD